MVGTSKCRRRTVRLIQGDCLDHMASIADGSVGLVLCDPPYGVTDCRWDRKIPLAPLWSEYRRLIRKGGVIALFAQQPFATELAAGASAPLRYEWVWDKGHATNFGQAKRMPMRRHENVLVFYEGQALYRPQGLRPCRPRTRKTERGGETYGKFGAGYVQTVTGYPQSILHFRRERGAVPCQKPVELLAYLIRTYTRPGEVVLDNAMGTGSTGVAAVQCGRGFIGIEKDPERFRMAEARIARAMRGE